jgi:hypothetical protein
MSPSCTHLTSLCMLSLLLTSCSSSELPDVAAFTAPAGHDIDAAINDDPEYVQITADGLPKLIAAIPVRGAENATPEQLSQLQTALFERVYAFHIGSADAILADRLRAEYTIRPDATKWHSDVLTRFYLKSGEQLPSDPHAIMRLLVDRNYGGQNGSGYALLYNELCARGSRIDLVTTQSIPPPIKQHLWDLYEDGANTFSQGVASHLPSVDYRHSPDDVLQSAGNLLIANVRLAASDSEGLQYSRIRRYYWSPADSQWLPMECLSLYARKRKADEFF